MTNIQIELDDNQTRQLQEKVNSLGMPSIEALLYELINVALDEREHEFEAILNKVLLKNRQLYSNLGDKARYISRIFREERDLLKRLND